jgi:primase-polymerase (primpol)-like protein
MTGDPYAGVDFDGALDPATGNLRDWAAPVVAALDSYTEVSPSGAGVKVIVRGHVPGERRRGGQVVMYDRARFFAVTGLRLSGTPVAIRPSQPALDRLYRQAFGAAVAQATQRRRCRGGPLAPT